MKKFSRLVEKTYSDMLCERKQVAGENTWTDDNPQVMLAKTLITQIERKNKNRLRLENDAHELMSTIKELKSYDAETSDLEDEYSEYKDEIKSHKLSEKTLRKKLTELFRENEGLQDFATN